MERAVPRHEVRRSPLRFEEAGTGWAREEGKRGVGRGVTSIDQMAQAYEILWGAFGLPVFLVFGILMCVNRWYNWYVTFLEMLKTKAEWTTLSIIKNLSF